MKGATKVLDVRTISLSLLLYRWLTLVLVCILFFAHATPKIPIFWAYSLILATFVYNLGLTLFHSRVLNRVLKSPVLLGIDILICALLIGLWEGWRSPYFLYSLSPILTASFFFQMRGGLIAALSYSVVYTIGILTNGYTPAVVRSMGEIDSYFTHYFTFFVVAGVVAYPSLLLEKLKKVIRENEYLSEKNKKLALAGERNRIAMEMHDGVIQTLSGAGLILEAYNKQLPLDPSEAKEKFNLVKKLIQRSVEDIRSTIFDLRLVDEEKDLVGWLKECVEEFESLNSAKTRLCVEGNEDGISDNLKKDVCLILQEALANVGKHARAEEVKVKFTVKDGVALVVEDNGKGFDVSKALRDSRKKMTMGLENMRKRAERLGGFLTVESEIGVGTRVEARIPEG